MLAMDNGKVALIFDKKDKPEPHHPSLSPKYLYLGQYHTSSSGYDLYYDAETNMVIAKYGDEPGHVLIHRVDDAPSALAVIRVAVQLAKERIARHEDWEQFDKLNLCPVCGSKLKPGQGYCRPCNEIDWWDDFHFFREWKRARKEAAM